MLLNTLATDAPEPYKHAERSFHFDRSLRLLTAQDYKNVFDQNDYRASHKNALMLVRINQQQHGRVGLVISKKNVRRSVDRNRIKRLIREQFRLNRDLFSGFDTILMARPGLGSLKNNDVCSLVDQLIKTVRKQQERKQKT